MQAAVAAELDPRAIYEVVGGKIEEVYDAQAVSISTFDEATGLLEFPYLVERGERFTIDPMPVLGFRKHVLDTGEPLLVNEDVAAAAERYGNPTAIAGEAPKSVLFVPLFTAGRPSGVISLQNVDREGAFSESDQRLLVTLAGSVSAALENARLLQETRQRNAELALINSVQAAIAGELDPQAIYDLVGDRLLEVFDAQVVSISVYDEASELLTFPYVIERGERLHESAIPLIGFRKARHGDAGAAAARGEHIGDRRALRQPIRAEWRADPLGALRPAHRRRSRDRCDLAPECGSDARVHRGGPAPADDARRRPGGGARQRSPRARDPAASDRARDREQRRAGARVTARPRRADRAGRANRCARHSTQTSPTWRCTTRPSGQIEFAYYYESGERRAEPPMPYGEGLTSQILRSRESTRAQP